MYGENEHSSIFKAWSLMPLHCSTSSFNSDNTKVTYSRYYHHQQ
jgi:hypothetical protein